MLGGEILKKKDRLGAEKIREFLIEDIGHGDLTSSSLIEEYGVATLHGNLKHA